MISTTDPETMTAEERRLEVAGILAHGLLRRVRTARTAMSPAREVFSERPETGLDVSAKTMICPSRNGESATVTRPAPMGDDMRAERHRAVLAPARCLRFDGKTGLQHPHQNRDTDDNCCAQSDNTYRASSR